MKLPKSIIKKYGITKKAWQIFKGTTRKARTSRGATSMKRRARTSRNSGLGGRKLMDGLYSPQGMIKSAILGVGAATIASQLPIDFKYKQEVAALAVGGIVGAGVVYLMRNVNYGSSSGIELN